MRGQLHLAVGAASWYLAEVSLAQVLSSSSSVLCLVHRVSQRSCACACLNTWSSVVFVVCVVTCVSEFGVPFILCSHSFTCGAAAAAAAACCVHVADTLVVLRASLGVHEGDCLLGSWVNIGVVELKLNK